MSNMSGIQKKCSKRAAAEKICIPLPMKGLKLRLIYILYQIFTTSGRETKPFPETFDNSP